MAGFGDTLKNAILDVVPGDAARKISNALTPGTTSGIDSAMQAHADRQHPVGPTRRADGSIRYPMDDK